jgi:hypothetical protein
MPEEPPPSCRRSSTNPQKEGPRARCRRSQAPKRELPGLKDRGRVARNVERTRRGKDTYCRG